MKRAWIAMPIALALLAACRPESGPAAPAAPMATPEPARPARIPAAAERPVLRIATIDGKTFDLAEQRGKWAIVNFWATWCGPCLKEMPELSALDAMREHIVVVGLAYEDNTPEAMVAFMKQHPVVYPIALVDFNDQKRGRLTLIRDLLDRLPETTIEAPALEFPPLAGKPAKERYGVLKPIPTVKA